MKTTVQALLSVLLGRDPNEEIIIENNELRVVSTVNLMSVPHTEIPAQGIINASTKPGHPLKDPDAPTMKTTKAITKPIDNANRAWKLQDLNTIATLRAGGASFEDIGKVLGRTAKAVSCQLGHIRKQNELGKNSATLM